MYLILGSAFDPCCTLVNSILKTRGHDVRIMDGLFSEPHRFAWRFAGGGSLRKGNSRIGVPGEWEAASGEIEGVLMRDIGFRAMHDWSESDAQYMSAEMQAALLGWLWSLPGVVVNRVPAWLFYRPRPSFLYWMPYLVRAGLRVPSTVIGNDTERLKDWRARHAEGAVLSPISDHTHFQLQTDAEWEGVMGIARHAPVLLEEAHGATQLACVVGDCVIWDGRLSGAVPEQAQALEARLCAFARSAGLNFVQIAVTEQLSAQQSYESGYSVVAVEPQVHFARFETETQKRIAEELANLLTGERKHLREREPIGIGAATANGRGAR